MRWLMAAFVAVHGLIHLMGFAKGMGYASLPQLGQPISRGMALLWLTASLLMLATAVTFIVWPRGWWMLGAVALVVSQAVIVSSWRDAWAGTIANAIVLAAVLHGWGTEGPHSFRAQFEQEVAPRLVRQTQTATVTEQDLMRLPEPVRRYLHAVGVAGRPRVQSYRIRFTGRIRSGPDASWMPFEAIQQSFADPPARFFLMRAQMHHLPVEAFHELSGGHATMRVKVAGMIRLVDARGEAMDQSETVTLLNDMCILAPATLIDPQIEWQRADARTACVRFTNGAHTVSATLYFAEDGRLADFVSDDRLRASPDGRTFTRLRFSTPIQDYRDFGPARLAARGEARWTLPEGEFTYGEFDVREVAYNVSRSGA